jgi:hypothetical protein
MFRKMALLCLLMTCSVSPLRAQQQPRQPKAPAERPPKDPKPLPAPRNRDPEGTVDRVRKALRLSANQVFQLRPLVHERNRQLDEVDQGRENASYRRAETQRIQDRFQSELRAILSLTQVDLFDRAVLARPGTFR